VRHMDAASIPSLFKELTVEAPQERAFRVFTAQMGGWWPREHHIGKSELKDVVVEPRVDGRWYETCVDGSECQWGRVLVWEPPRRLVLAWQLGADWQYDPNLVTEVELNFLPEGARRTRVTFEHRNLERFGPAAKDLASQMAAGWDGILASYGALSAQGAP